MPPNIEDIEPNIPTPPPLPTPILLIILFLIYKLSKMKTPIMTTNDIGNGSNIEIVTYGYGYSKPRHLVHNKLFVVIIIDQIASYTIDTRLLLI